MPMEPRLGGYRGRALQEFTQRERGRQSQLTRSRPWLRLVLEGTRGVNPEFLDVDDLKRTPWPVAIVARSGLDGGTRAGESRLALMVSAHFILTA